MKLTTEEKIEKAKILSDIENQYPTQPGFQARLIYFLEKESENCCLNPRCNPGYVGNNDEVKCPICEGKLGNMNLAFNPVSEF